MQAKPGQSLAEGGVLHGHFRRGRPPSRSKEAFGRDDSISITASDVNPSCIGLAFASLMRPSNRPNCASVGGLGH